MKYVTFEQHDKNSNVNVIQNLLIFIVLSSKVPGWNKVTLVYDGQTMTGMTENWRGKQQKQAKLSGMRELIY